MAVFAGFSSGPVSNVSLSWSGPGGGSGSQAMHGSTGNTTEFSAHIDGLYVDGDYTVTVTGTDSSGHTAHLTETKHIEFRCSP